MALRARVLLADAVVVAVEQVFECGLGGLITGQVVHDLHATMLAMLGFDHEKFTFRQAGRDFRLTDVHGKVIHDLIA